MIRQADRERLQAAVSSIRKLISRRQYGRVCKVTQIESGTLTLDSKQDGDLSPPRKRMTDLSWTGEEGY